MDDKDKGQAYPTYFFNYGHTNYARHSIYQGEEGLTGRDWFSSRYALESGMVPTGYGGDLHSGGVDLGGIS
jgi:hypothetical protein